MTDLLFAHEEIGSPVHDFSKSILDNDDGESPMPDLKRCSLPMLSGVLSTEDLSLLTDSEDEDDDDDDDETTTTTKKRSSETSFGRVRSNLVRSEAPLITDSDEEDEEHPLVRGRTSSSSTIRTSIRADLLQSEAMINTIFANLASVEEDNNSNNGVKLKSNLLVTDNAAGNHVVCSSPVLPRETSLSVEDLPALESSNEDSTTTNQQSRSSIREELMRSEKLFSNIFADLLEPALLVHDNARPNFQKSLSADKLLNNDARPSFRRATSDAELDSHSTNSRLQKNKNKNQRRRRLKRNKNKKTKSSNANKNRSVSRWDSSPNFLPNKLSSSSSQSLSNINAKIRRWRSSEDVTKKDDAPAATKQSSSNNNDSAPLRPQRLQLDDSNHRFQDNCSQSSSDAPKLAKRRSSKFVEDVAVAVVAEIKNRFGASQKNKNSAPKYVRRRISDVNNDSDQLNLSLLLSDAEDKNNEGDNNGTQKKTLVMGESSVQRFVTSNDHAPKYLHRRISAALSDGEEKSCREEDIHFVLGGGMKRFENCVDKSSPPKYFKHHRTSDVEANRQQ